MCFIKFIYVKIIGFQWYVISVKQPTQKKGWNMGCLPLFSKGLERYNSLTKLKRTNSVTKPLQNWSTYRFSSPKVMHLESDSRRTCPSLICHHMLQNCNGIARDGASLNKHVPCYSLPKKIITFVLF